MSSHRDLRRDERRARRLSSWRSIRRSSLNGWPFFPRRMLDDHEDAPLSPNGRLIFSLIILVIIAGGIVGITWSAVGR